VVVEGISSKYQVEQIGFLGLVRSCAVLCLDL